MRRLERMLRGPIEVEMHGGINGFSNGTFKRYLALLR